MKRLSMAKRHAYILEQLNKLGEVRVTDLSEEMDVSSVTIRKDLKQLEDKKLLFRSHGLIFKDNPYARDRHVNDKETLNVEQKLRIARKAAEFIQGNDAVILASGTTIFYLAQVLDPSEQVTILTSALNVATELIKKQMVEVVQLGGIVRKTSTSVNGPFAQIMLEQFACSKLFLGVDGIDLQYGFTTTNLMEANVNQHMMKAAQRTIVLADSSKFGRKGFGRICLFDEVDQIITDSGVNEKTVQALENLGVEVTIV